MKKFIAFLAVAALVLCPLVSCERVNPVMDEERTYEVSSDIYSLKIELNAAEVEVIESDSFSVVSNLKYLSVTEDNGVLKIKDEAERHTNYKDPTLTLYVPRDTVFCEVDFLTGAGVISLNTLYTEELTMMLGAGDVQIDELRVSDEATVRGGAGKLTINGSITDLDMEMGVGELKLVASLFGDNELKLGIGRSDITLIGDKSNYTVNAEKGVGKITVDGKEISNSETVGDGENALEIEGGIGDIIVSFTKE